ncbi:ribosomal protein L22 [Wolbachia endosymbiont of Armadillidium vulgare str. wVulC]|uniref:Large ribosomal subunit protein uL22 n=1 Tax=Wolbachia endosymbiont of Armadillidium arcangelii TaxID=3158571 RepID=A0AAU7Q2Z9_9RICK|nr:50S ribosomal protein L22 [Wolbachia endosymbiont of Armadillidium vulgare]KLT23237.1 ribosomal protein L22 [Wolbachia endosymbiont of Armadillidium vulgare str. wVulC]OJH30822.1 50S ribosomal protein L22 [Wolbachia endosymbiont of Armadillidium vulgare]OJH31843.1 50S ribosomal protein L22 [Wolbachia endosymbiont of Armadillidium vulgare]
MKNRDVIVKAGSRVLKSTPRKLNLAADLVRNKKVSFANIQLRFCEKKAADFIMKVLNSAIANAQNNYGLDIDNLYIKEILIGKSLTLRRVYPKAMGRANRVSKRYSNITVKLGVII